MGRHGDLVTPRFLQTALGITTPESVEQVRALTALDLGPLRIETTGPVGIWNDGRGAVDVLYLRCRGNPLQAVGARWFLVAERGVVRFDEEVRLLIPPLGDRITTGSLSPTTSNRCSGAVPPAGPSPSLP